MTIFAQLSPTVSNFLLDLSPLQNQTYITDLVSVFLSSFSYYSFSKLMFIVVSKCKTGAQLSKAPVSFVIDCYLKALRLCEINAFYQTLLPSTSTSRERPQAWAEYQHGAEVKENKSHQRQSRTNASRELERRRVSGCKQNFLANYHYWHYVCCYICAKWTCALLPRTAHLWSEGAQDGSVRRRAFRDRPHWAALLRALQGVEADVRAHIHFLLLHF